MSLKFPEERIKEICELFRECRRRTANEVALLTIAKGTEERLKAQGTRPGAGAGAAIAVQPRAGLGSCVTAPQRLQLVGSAVCKVLSQSCCSLAKASCLDGQLQAGPEVSALPCL